jgi:hypothetical protein
MFIWGHGTKTMNLGSVGVESCATCERPRNFNLILQYRYFHAYWIFKAVTKKSYLKLCEICSRGWELDEKKVASVLQRAPSIPFMDRFGCLIAFLIVAALIGMSMLTS